MPAPGSLLPSRLEISEAVHMPWATGALSPRARAYASFRCVGLKSPDTAAKPSSSVLVSVRDRLADWPTSISANVRFSTMASSLMIGSRPASCIPATLAIAAAAPTWTAFLMARASSSTSVQLASGSYRVMASAILAVSGPRSFW